MSESGPMQPETQHEDSWRDLFHSYAESVNAPPLKFAIEGFLQEDGVTMIGGPSGHGKTFIMLSMVRSLLEGMPLFGYHSFKVTASSERVVYLVPESGIGPFWHRLKKFHLDEQVKAGKLYYRTLSAPELLSLNDPRLKEAVNGAHVFLDTAIRFMEGDENAAAESKIFAQQLFNLQTAGARSITGAHHSPKGFSREEFATLENVLRGSGDIGAMLATCWAIRQIDESTNRVYVTNVKPRDFQPCEAFILEGRPHIDDIGQFKMTAQPGEAGPLSDYTAKGRRGPKVDPQDDYLRDGARQLKKEGLSVRDIAQQMGVKKWRVEQWLK